jgi:hypothetical protein
VVCQRIYSILRSVKPHARYTPFGVKKKLVVSLIMPHINYGNVVFSTVDSASPRRLNVAFHSCLRYVHDTPRQGECFSSCAYYYRCFVGDSFEYLSFDIFV